MLSDRKEIILFICVAVLFLEHVSLALAWAQQDRDPFSPLVNKSGLILIPREVDIDGLSLGGIIYSESTPVAVINDEVLEEGETIGGYVIVAIEEKSVILKNANQEYVLKLEEEWTGE